MFFPLQPENKKVLTLGISKAWAVVYMKALVFTLYTVYKVLVTCSQVLEASESIVPMLLLVVLLLVELNRATVNVFSILSSSSSKRITAITDSSFKDLKRKEKKKRIIRVTSKSREICNQVKEYVLRCCYIR